MGKARTGMTTRKQTKAAGQKKNKQVKEDAAALNEPLNFRERMIMAMTCTYTTTFESCGARMTKRRNNLIHQARET